MKILSLFFILLISSSCTTSGRAAGTLVFTGYGSGAYSSHNQKLYADLLKKGKLSAADILYTCYVEDENDYRINCSSYDSPKLKNFTQMASMLKASGLELTIRVYVDLKNQKWRAYWNPSKPAVAFRNLEKLLVRLSKVAARVGADSFMIGSEYEVLTQPKNLPYWKNIIKKVKKEFRGRILYAANGNLNKGNKPEYYHVPFWGLLDTVGINYYPPFKGLSTKQNLSKHHILELKKLKDFSKAQKKMLAITEVGFPLAASGVKTPYKWDYPKGERPDPLLRAKTMKIFLDSTKQLKIRNIHLWRYLVKEKSLHPLGYVVDQEVINLLPLLK